MKKRSASAQDYKENGEKFRIFYVNLHLVMQRAATLLIADFLNRKTK